MPQYSKLKNLTFSNCGLKNDSVQQLFNAIKTANLKLLEEIDLDGNYITEVIIRYMTNAFIKINATKLYYLYLGSNNIKSKK